jgi:hypothetical protein
VIALPAASLAGLLWFFWMVYGRASLGAAYGPGLSSDVSLARIPWGVLALLTDRQYGLFAVSPVWALGLFGLAASMREQRGLALPAGALATATVAVGASFSMWWGGACPPARFLVPALPALAVVLAPALRARSGLAAALGGAGLAVVGLVMAAPRAIHNRTDGESALLRFLAPGLDLDASLPSFVPEATWVAVVLALSLLAVVVVAWARGLRGLVASLVAYALVAGPMRTRPLVDPRGATEQLLEAWEPARLRGPLGLPDPARLSFPLDLPRSPWLLRPGDVRQSRRDDLPPGAYRIEVEGRAPGAPPGTNVARLEVTARDLRLGQVYLQAGAPATSLSLVLPMGARGLRLGAVGAQEASAVLGARAVPLELLPASARPLVPWPRVPQEDRYRVPRGAIRVTVLDRAVPEGDGFRLEGATGSFLVEGPAGGEVVVRLVRPRPQPGDRLVWSERATPAGAALRLRIDSPLRLAGAALVPVRVEADGAWVAFDPAG